jgi:hypothetical protein
MKLGQNACLGNTMGQVSDLGPSWSSCLKICLNHTFAFRKSKKVKRCPLPVVALVETFNKSASSLEPGQTCSVYTGGKGLSLSISLLGSSF